MLFDTKSLYLTYGLFIIYHDQNTKIHGKLRKKGLIFVIDFTYIMYRHNDMALTNWQNEIPYLDQTL